MRGCVNRISSHEDPQILSCRKCDLSNLPSCHPYDWLLLLPIVYFADIPNVLCRSVLERMLYVCQYRQACLSFFQSQSGFAGQRTLDIVTNPFVRPLRFYELLRVPNTCPSCSNLLPLKLLISCEIRIVNFGVTHSRIVHSVKVVKVVKVV